jgi:hypothetical protein
MPFAERFAVANVTTHADYVAFGNVMGMIPVIIKGQDLITGRNATTGVYTFAPNHAQTFAGLDITIAACASKTALNGGWGQGIFLRFQMSQVAPRTVGIPFFNYSSTDPNNIGGSISIPYVLAPQMEEAYDAGLAEIARYLRSKAAGPYGGCPCSNPSFVARYGADHPRWPHFYGMAVARMGPLFTEMTHGFGGGAGRAPNMAAYAAQAGLPNDSTLGLKMSRLFSDGWERDIMEHRRVLPELRAHVMIGSLFEDWVIADAMIERVAAAMGKPDDLCIGITNLERSWGTNGGGSYGIRMRQAAARGNPTWFQTRSPGLQPWEATPAIPTANASEGVKRGFEHALSGAIFSGTNFGTITFPYGQNPYGVPATGGKVVAIEPAPGFVQGNSQPLTPTAATGWTAPANSYTASEYALGVDTRVPVNVSVQERLWYFQPYSPSAIPGPVDPPPVGTATGVYVGRVVKP